MIALIRICCRPLEKAGLLQRHKPMHDASQDALPVYGALRVERICGQKIDERSDHRLSDGVAVFRHPSGGRHDQAVQPLLLLCKATVGIRHGVDGCVGIFPLFCRKKQLLRPGGSAFAGAGEQIIKAFNVVLERRRFDLQALGELPHGNFRSPALRD